MLLLRFSRQIYMKPNIDFHKPNRKFFMISIWGVFLIILIAQIFWLGWEVERLKDTIEQNEKKIEANLQVIDDLQNYILQEIKKEQNSKFI
jgi:predicted Holliday junction resolvase-like endonuclease